MGISRVNKRAPYRRPENILQPVEDPYRVVVMAAPGSKSKTFIWQVVSSTQDGLSVKASSTETYKTMHEAYAAGAVALSRLPPPQAPW